jgi:mRNA-degrading endonuclease toxin of MazEF toxin-antitoxin module
MMSCLVPIQTAVPLILICPCITSYKNKLERSNEVDFTARFNTHDCEIKCISIASLEENSLRKIEDFIAACSEENELRRSF